MIEVGKVEAIFRYPVKSMRGERLDAANIGFHGIDGDRRLALRRIQDRSGFPWLTGTRLPELILFTPFRRGESADSDLPTHVRTPEGKELPVFSDELAGEIERRNGMRVEMTHLRDGVFDDGYISVITTDTIDEIGKLAGVDSDMRRFRPNLVVRLHEANAFEEDKWLGNILSFGDDGPRVSVTVNDIRCAMINLDPDSAKPSPEMLKTVVRVRENLAGVYGTVIRTGQVRVGQTVLLHDI